ncbi:MAG: hypothetical protein EHM45_24995 [Desulfobacteraceae bacterium]|nr:MAG: hypothetical protein EHM45_24995 [Desulfobacteraceae bacterium]
MKFYAKSEIGGSEALYVFTKKKSHDEYCGKAVGVSPITASHYYFLTKNAAKRGGQYTAHNMAKEG